MVQYDIDILSKIAVKRPKWPTNVDWLFDAEAEKMLLLRES